MTLFLIENFTVLCECSLAQTGQVSLHANEKQSSLAGATSDWPLSLSLFYTPQRQTRARDKTSCIVDGSVCVGPSTTRGAEALPHGHDPHQ